MTAPITAREYHAHLVDLAMQAYDASIGPDCGSGVRDLLLAAVTERMAQASAAYALEIDRARREGETSGRTIANLTTQGKRVTERERDITRALLIEHWSGVGEPPSPEDVWRQANAALDAEDGS